MKSGRSRSRISSTGCDVSLDTGLSEEEVQHRLSRYGSNTLRLFRQRGMLDLLFDQFKSLVVGLLAVAALTSFVYGHWLEGIAIVVVLGLNGAIGFEPELRASRSMEVLRELS